MAAGCAQRAPPVRASRARAGVAGKTHNMSSLVRATPMGVPKPGS